MGMVSQGKSGQLCSITKTKILPLSLGGDSWMFGARVALGESCGGKSLIRRCRGRMRKMLTVNTETM